ncbi:alpha/beta hydrolase [bacterium]|nr:alpha/beta hydrolase [bacterium]
MFNKKNFGVIIILVIAIITALNVASHKEPQIIEPIVTVTPTPIVELTPTPEPTIIYEGTSPQRQSHFIEVTPKIAGEQGYVAFPKVVTVNNPPAIVMYYHGSTQRITTNFSEEVMKNMRTYGTFFTEKNVAFLASNQHGDNWGSKTAVEDSRALIKWVRERYKTSPDVYILGFSMGGMPAMRHVILYPKEVKRIALLAPAQQVETYTTGQIKLFRDVPLKVWHGTSDSNVPYWVTEELIAYFKKQNTPIEVVTLKGKIHWDVDLEYKEDVYKWFTMK